MRRLPALALSLSLLSLAACESSTGAEVYRVSGFLDNTGFVSVPLPREVGNIDRLPALTCNVGHPDDAAWFVVGSVELPEEYFGGIPREDRVLENCILEADPASPNRLLATIEGQPPNWRYQFVVVY